MNFLRLLLWLALAVLAEPLFAQQGGFIAGIVHDRSGGTVGGAEIRVQSEVTGARQKAYCDANGSYSSAELAEGTYKITVRRDGFRTLTQTGVRVLNGKTLRADFVIEVLPLAQEVTVEAAPNDEDPTASGLVVSRESAQNNLPANGRDVHALFAVIPGATLTPASISNGGQFTVGGQRPNTNSFRVDGVNGNVGIGIISVPGAYPGATLPGMTTIGSMQSLVSKEETQRVDLRPVDFSTEFGERPGAQISIETRSGTNEFHGSVFGYIRPQAFNSHDWFSQSVGANLPAASLNGWGGSLGGPLWRNHTYFFASFERADVHDQALQLLPVPSMAARAAAGATYQEFLASFPLPTGRALSATQAVGNSPLQKAASLANESVRLDHMLNKHIHLFGRFSYVPSASSSIELGTAYSQFGWLSATGGMNLASGNIVQEFRFNYSQATASAERGGNNFVDKPSIFATVSAIFIPPNLPIGVGYVIGPPVIALTIGGIGQSISGQAGINRQKQQDATYRLARTVGRHNLKVGSDYLRLYPSYEVLSTTASITSQGIDALLSGVPLGITEGEFTGPSYKTQEYSFFGQDVFHINDNLQLHYGLRWEFTPPNFAAANGYEAPLFNYIGYWNGINGSPTPFQNTVFTQGARWVANNHQFAPRAGLAYRVRSLGIVLRMGTGIFYDTDLGSALSNVNPLNSWTYTPTAANPNTTFTAPPFVNQLLALPRVWEWRTSIEKSVTERSLFSASYFGSSARNLLRTEATVTPESGILQSLEFTSHGRSSYQAMIAQFAGNVTPNLYTLVSYTWSHSIDIGSSDTATFLAPPGYNDTADRGSSNFDVRYVLSASLSYRLQAVGFRAPLRRLLGGWNISSTVQARSGFPFDVTTVDRSIGLGFDSTGRADVVGGEPMWIHSNAAPGGRMLNPAAFAVPESGVNGTLGRNVLTGNGLFQIDASLRRTFRLYRGFSMEASASTFNLFNHPSFANPVNYLGSALFGQSTSSANLMLGSGSPTTGLTPIFQAGGPRTMEFSLRFSF